MATKTISKIAISVAACAIGFGALTMADASLPDVKHGIGSASLVSASFLLSLVLLTYSSLSVDMRLTYQVLLVYLSVYLLLPGFNHDSANRFPFYGMSYSNEIRFEGALVVFLFIMSSFIGTLIFTTRRQPDANIEGADLHPSFRIKPNVKVALALTFVSLVMAVAYLSIVGIGGAFATRSVEGGVVVAKSTAGLFISFPRIITLLPITYAILLIRHSTRPRYGWALLIANLPIVLTVNFPPALPRFQLFGNILLVLVLTVNFAKVRNRALLAMAFLGGAVVAMPIVDFFTRGGGTLDQFDPTQVLSAYLRSGDFDGLQSVNNAIVYVNQFGVQHGHQILSAFLFFVPRSFWPSKGEPTGSITAEAAGYEFFNISQPLPSEVFVDFGYVGVVLGGIAIGAAIAYIDRRIDSLWRYDIRARLIAVLTVGYALPLYRGSLLAMVGPFMSVAVTFYILSKIGLKQPRAASAKRGVRRTASPLSPQTA